MKEKQEVIEKFQEMRGRHLKERKDQFLSIMPINCVHNVRLHVRGKGYFRFCQNPLVIARCSSRQRMFLCQDENTARRCRVFACKNTPESVEAEFDEILRSPSRCGHDYPKLAMLIWFLQEIEVSSRMVRFWRMVLKLFGSVWGIITFKWW